MQGDSGNIQILGIQGERDKKQSPRAGGHAQGLGPTVRASVNDSVRPMPQCACVFKEKISFDLTDFARRTEKPLTCSW